YLAGERLELRTIRQLTIVKQVRDLQKRRAFGQLLDRVTTVAQDPQVTVDERHGRTARSRVGEARVVGHQSEIFGARFDLTEVEGLDGAVGNLNFVGLAGSIV